MAVTVFANVNDAQLRKVLRKNGNEWAKQMQHATQDMKRAAPGIVAKRTASVYTVKQGEVNPSSYKFAGVCSMSGGVADLSMTYRGRQLTLAHFGLRHSGVNPDYPYTVSAAVLKGQRKTLGKVKRPWSQGGAYGAKSPGMMLPGIIPPVRRFGMKVEAASGLSVPQMVGSRRHINATMKELQNRQIRILQQRLAKFGLA